jgi:phosphatidylinositol glycan class T
MVNYKVCPPNISLLISGDVLDSISYHPSAPPKPTTTTIHLSLILPAQSELVLTIPFTKLMLKYTEHRPDAERGREISSGVLTLLDLVEDVDDDQSVPGIYKSDRTRIYTPRLLLDIPTPDFSMPYNVIIMSSTVMAVFFGLMHGSLTRRWGWVQIPKEIPVPVEIPVEVKQR